MAYLEVAAQSFRAPGTVVVVHSLGIRRRVRKERRRREIPSRVGDRRVPDPASRMGREWIKEAQAAVRRGVHQVRVRAGGDLEVLGVLRGDGRALSYASGDVPVAVARVAVRFVADCVGGIAALAGAANWGAKFPIFATMMMSPAILVSPAKLVRDTALVEFAVGAGDLGSLLDNGGPVGNTGLDPVCLPLGHGT